MSMSWIYTLPVWPAFMSMSISAILVSLEITMAAFTSFADPKAKKSCKLLTRLFYTTTVYSGSTVMLRTPQVFVQLQALTQQQRYMT